MNCTLNGMYLEKAHFYRLIYGYYWAYYICEIRVENKTPIKEYNEKRTKMGSLELPLNITKMENKEKFSFKKG